ncbi:hypothetical protein MesoLj131a_35590 [Mesorhizobium sp. 131-2-1]|nr:hypothetical protein MesoLj131a_35590 [Mesorhizobium sp. 131-2-1]
MVEHLLSQGPYSLLRRLNLLGRTDVFDRASAHILHRAGLAVWDKQNRTCGRNRIRLDDEADGSAGTMASVGIAAVGQGAGSDLPSRDPATASGEISCKATLMF